MYQKFQQAVGELNRHRSFYREARYTVLAYGAREIAKKARETLKA